MSRQEPSVPRHAVLLVDLGPGDPDLWTVRARAALEQAAWILADQALPPEVAAAVSDQAEISQWSNLDLLSSDTGALTRLADTLQAGKVIVRLRLARRGVPGALLEEASQLRALGVPFELVAGVSAAEGVPAYAGVPLIRRNGFPSYRVLIWDGDPALPLRLDGTADETLICLAPRSALPDVSAALLKAGRDAETPVAVITNGTRPEQQTQTGTLGALPSPDERPGPDVSAVLIAGSNVYGRDVLNWFESRPLFGQRILVTRARRQAGALSTLLQACGAAVLEVPTIEVAPPGDAAPMDAALGRLDIYDWLFFTSVNGVETFFARLLEKGSDLRDLKGKRICTIGPATARAVERFYLRVDLVPEEYRAEAVIPALEGFLGGRERLKGLTVLLPRAKVARDVLPDQLRALGTRIDVVEAYQTLLPKGSGPCLRTALAARQVTGVTFTSSSTVTHLAALLETDDLSAALAGVWVACIGPITADTAKKFRLSVDIMPKDYTVPGLASAIAGHFGLRSPSV